MTKMNLQEVAFIRNCHIKEIYKDAEEGRLTVDVDGLVSEENSKKYLSIVSSKKNAPLVFNKYEGKFSVKQLAEALKIPKETIYTAIKAKKLRSIKNGRRIVLNWKDVKYWMNESYEEPQKREKPKRLKTPSLLDVYKGRKLNLRKQSLSL